MLVVSALVLPLGARATISSIRVRDEAQFAVAVAAFRDRGGTIVLLPHIYRSELVVPPRSGRLLRIIGGHGVRVGRVVLDHTQRVLLERLTIAPVTQDAWVEIDASRRIELDRVVITATGTEWSSSVDIPNSSDVTIRRSEFKHCGDRSPEWSNCLRIQRATRRVTVEDSWFHDCFGCDFIHGRIDSGLTVRRTRFERALPCSIGRIRCGHQDLIELFAGCDLRFEANWFGVYDRGGAQLNLTGAMDRVVVVNNVFLGRDPDVPGYRARVGLIIGARGAADLPRNVHVISNTILTGTRRSDGYLGSVRMSHAYLWSVPRSERPILANNVIGVLDMPGHVCRETRRSVSNVVLRGRTCARTDHVGDAHLDAIGRPSAESLLLIDKANRRYAPSLDVTGWRRGSRPDIGAYEYRGPKLRARSRA